MFGQSLVVNRALKPAREAIGEAAGEAIADFAGASGARRTRIVENTRRAVNVGGSLATSFVLADASGTVDAVDSLLG